MAFSVALQLSKARHRHGRAQEEVFARIVVAKSGNARHAGAVPVVKSGLVLD